MLRWLRIAGLALMTGWVCQAQGILPYTAADKQLLWEEASATANGLAYHLNLYIFPTKAAADATLAQGRQALWRIQQKRQITLRYNELPYLYRTRIAALAGMNTSEPVPHPNGKDWLVFEMLGKVASKFGNDIVPDQWLAAHAAIALPSPQELRTRPELVTRRALNQLKSADDLDLALKTRTLSVANLNDSCSNGSTPLVNAIFRNDPALMEALLARGADLNRSTPDYYPLTLAIFLKQPDPVRILLEHHADVNGAPDPLETPLMAACSVADQALAQRLLDAGANPLDSRASGPMGMRQSTASFASPEQKSYHDWFQQVVNEALRKTGQYEWSAWIDQSGKRTRITQDCTIALRKMPFKLITRMKEETPFLVIASEDMDLLKQMDDARFHRMALSGAFTGASDADSKYLGIASLAMAEGYFTHFSNNDWGYYAEPRMRRGTVRVAGKGPVEYVHSVEELDTPDGHHWGKDFPGAALAMVMGVLPPIGSGTELYRPLKFTLKF